MSKTAKPKSGALSASQWNSLTAVLRRLKQDGKFADHTIWSLAKLLRTPINQGGSGLGFVNEINVREGLRIIRADDLVKDAAEMKPGGKS